MTTFERYFIADKETHKETKGAYYHLLENEKVVDTLLREFGLLRSRAYYQWSCTGASGRGRKPGEMQWQSDRY